MSKIKSSKLELVTDFFNKVCSDLDKKYFPHLKYYRDDDKCAALHYAVERFSNGVLGYNKFIAELSKNCNDTKENIHAIVSQYVKSFGDFKYKA